MKGPAGDRALIERECLGGAVALNSLLQVPGDEILGRIDFVDSAVLSYRGSAFL
jgi:hypothetical protein